MIKTGVFYSTNLILPMIGIVINVIKNFNIIPKLPKPILLFVGIHICYFLIIEPTDIDALKYLLARVTFIIFFTIFIYKSSYEFILKTIKIIAHIGFVLLTMSVFVNKSKIGYGGLFINPNDLAMLGTFNFGIFSLNLFSNRVYRYYNVSISFIMIILSGSRIALVSIFIIFLIHNIKNIFNSMIFLFILGIPFFNYIQSTFNRAFMSGDIFSGRTINWFIAVDQIKQKLYTGHGLLSYNGTTEDPVYIYDKNWGALSAHSGYLAYFMMFGLPLGMIIISIHILPTIRALLDKKKYKYDYLYLSMILLNCQWLVYALVETSFAGVNDYSAILYVSSFIILINYTHGNLHQKRKLYEVLT